MVSVCYGKVFQERFASWGKSGRYRQFCNSKFAVLFGVGVVVNGYEIISRHKNLPIYLLLTLLRVHPSAVSFFHKLC